MTESKNNEKSANDAQQKLAVTAVKKDRDSLIVASNEFSQRSVKQWQDAQKELALAKETEPRIEEKAKANAEFKTQGSVTGSREKEVTAKKENAGDSGVASSVSSKPI